MLFKATLAAPLSFARTVGILESLLDVVNVDLTPEGIKVITMDAAHVFVLELVLFRREAFLTYQIGRDLITVGLRLKLLHNVLKHVKADDMVVFSLKDEDDTFNVSILKSGVLEKKSEYKICQIVLDQERISMPDREYCCEILMPTSVLASSCTELQGLGEQLRIAVSDEELTLEGNSYKRVVTFLLLNFFFAVVSEMVAGKVFISKKNGDGIAVQCQEPYSDMFKFSYFAKMAKGTARLPEAEFILLQLGPESPLSLSYRLERMGALNFFLAPLIEVTE
ncbi:hypothetical protein QOT17_007550 [Balamuthia mandrillaris]